MLILMVRSLGVFRLYCYNLTRVKFERSGSFNWGLPVLENQKPTATPRKSVPQKEFSRTRYLSMQEIRRLAVITEPGEKRLQLDRYYEFSRFAPGSVMQ